MLKVSAKAPARQPINMPPKRLYTPSPRIPMGMGMLNRFTTFPNVTPKIISVSIAIRLSIALYFSDNFSKTPNRVINATYPADVPPPATKQNRQNNILSVNIYSFLVSGAIYYDTFVNVLFV